MNSSVQEDVNRTREEKRMVFLAEGRKSSSESGRKRVGGIGPIQSEEVLCARDKWLMHS